MVKLWDLLEPVRKLPKSRIETTELLDFSGVIFRAASMPSQYVDSIAVSGGCVCRKMVRKHGTEMPNKLVSYFYHVLQSLLTAKDDVIIFTVLTNSAKIFSLGLHGSYVLIPSYYLCISSLVNLANQRLREATFQTMSLNPY
jgi:hypothetical protein